MTSQWPLHSFLEFGALPGAVPCARLHTRQLLWEWGLAALTDSTELVVSELVTNAIQASRATGQASPVRLWLLSDKTQVLVLVWDANAHPPVQADVSDETENGRGLVLVEAISQQWAWYYPSDGEAGKYVWALIAVPDDDRKGVLEKLVGHDSTAHHG
jgi:anti-sigma regulatory factor (Ser/Thr protein kinase)